MLQLKDNPISQCNLKFSSKGDFEGYASIFNSNDAVNDTILPGAFKSSLESGQSIKMFVNHDHKQVPIGTWKEMREDEKGLFAVGNINLEHKDGPSVYSALKRGDVDGLSIGFNTSCEDYQRKSEGGRVFKNLKLKEASVVTFPCEEDARVTATKMQEILNLEDLKSIERWLSDSLNVSRKMAVSIVSQIKSLSLSDSVNGDNEITLLKKKLAIADAKLASRSLLHSLKTL